VCIIAADVKLNFLLRGNHMKNTIVIICLFVLSISFTSLGFNDPTPSLKSNLNRDLVISNLMNGVNSENQGLKISSTYFLGEIQSSQAVIPLMKILKNDENEESRIMAALSLLKIGDARGMFAIKQAISFDDSERVKKMCTIFYQNYLSTK